MNFKMNTKPLADALDLGIVDSNISRFYSKSTMTTLTATKDTLVINLETPDIVTELTLHGEGDEDGPSELTVNASTLKGLVHLLESNTVTLAFEEDCLIIYSGKSKYVLEKRRELEESSSRLAVPRSASLVQEKAPINKESWKFIKDNQLFAIGVSFNFPVYTHVWVGSEGDVLVGDFDISVFTHSKQTGLGPNCLLRDTIINLLNAVPDGAELYRLPEDGRPAYLLVSSTDAFDYRAEFRLQYETDSLNYGADGILGLMEHDDTGSVAVSTTAMSRFLAQAALLSMSGDEVVNFGVQDHQLVLKGDHIDCKVDVEGDCPEFSAGFKLTTLRPVIANLSKFEKFRVAPHKAVDSDEVGGISLWTDNLTIVLGAVD